MIQGGKTAIYKWLEHHQEIFACLNRESKVCEKEVKDKNESNVQGMHSIPEQSQAMLQTASNYTIAQDVVVQEHPVIPDLSPHKQSTFQDLKMLVSNIDSSLASCQKHFQSEIGKINQSLINLVNTETLEDKLRQIESRHKLEVNLLKERVSQLELENYNLKEQVTKFTNFQKGCNKRMGRIDNDLSRIKQKESEKKSTDSVSSLENSDEHSSNSDHARVSINGYARQEINQNGNLPSYAATTIPIAQQTIPARRLRINEAMNPRGGQNSVNRFTTGPSGNMEDNNTRSTVHVMETRNFRPTVSPTISKQVQFPSKVPSMRENFTTTPPQQGMTGGRPYYQQHSAGVNLRNKESTYEYSEILLLIESNG